jgi:hypothetical protein
MPLMLKEKRIDADADQNHRQARAQVEAQVLGFDEAGQPLPQRQAGGTLDRTPERNRTGPDARKSQSQVFSP